MQRHKSDHPTKNCTIEGCERPLRAKGRCTTHYNQLNPNRHVKKLVPCAFCGVEVLKHSGGGRKYGQVCSDQCRQWLTTPYCTLPADHWARWYGKVSKWKPKTPNVTRAERGRLQRSPLRVAIEDGDQAGLIDALFALADLTENGCWQWPRAAKDGYPIYQMALKDGRTRSYRLHRLALEAAMKKPLGIQAAHHRCANSRCVNPDHLQPISFRENTAEMMQRNYYIERIRELEMALASVDPDHPKLMVVSLPAAA